ncbi:MAG: porphobilinogen synthase [Epsilonproteobacteria bacterium]|nr:porphobilinogen synthase [Campylobacterota bacterium]OIO16066.1 MAG: delta-aminolevulinic acid dehydratase [Helicobacteraceae bacterium CG1_02_36_14]PIP10221.1 MAG: porphobilinogen synthase [Sulfurimonas sp. CG23_combo_of_CG06-09_8_20_14_all_36_33]PIS26458.1 MAG: porphobilinogen synthase [Sulfurimonas sp. CG08_land_8_20_14_0_20_36_33]PIU33920.1 MAG: porphobilinogen synthase [Sulfurimonas sp. CG07_land_8_20_14_0_80_36_56]PIV03748.1 MAG: porphobilinogen synthase [Sulfurimonas sp. CG03_land_8_
MFQRFRRTRLNSHLRSLVRETHVRVDDFIYPLFIRPGKGIKNEVSSMPGVFQMSIDEVLKECVELKELGIYSIILFGIPDVKDSIGSDSLCEHGIIASSIRAIKEAHPEMFIVTDLCFCEYTDHGHCGIIDMEHETVNNDATLEISAKQAIIHAQAGADMIAPSGMMDGIIQTLREALDGAGYENLPIMSYSTKFASGYYGPFRDVAESTPSFGNRASYQMDPANRREALNESISDEMQGADILMVKPALAYLDIVREIKDNTSLPMAVYNVSGEYAMLKLAQKHNLIDYDRVLMETMVSFKRAGADIIISYHAKEVAKLLKN